MASIPGASINLTGASGSQGLLAPMGSWKAIVLPQGGHASQSSTGTLITFDSAAIASRFAANNWIQAGLSVANIRQVSAVGGNSLSVSGAALTVTQNDRIFLIGNTQPTVTGGSATYTTPASRIRQRGDDGATLYTNSMVTTDSNGLAQFWAEQNTFDVIIQDANGTNQGSIIDLPVGTSSTTASVFGATVTINASLGVTGHVTMGNTVTINGILGVTGWATFGSTVTMHAALGVTGTVAIGSTLTAHGNVGTTGYVLVGTTLTVNGSAGVTGSLAVGSALSVGTTSTLSGMAVIFGVSITGNTVLLGTSAVGTTELDSNATVSPIRTVRFGTTAVALTGSEQVRGFTIYTPTAGNVGVMVAVNIPYSVGLGGDTGSRANARLYIGNVIKAEGSNNLAVANVVTGVSWSGNISFTHIEPQMAASGVTFEIRDVNTTNGVALYRGDLCTTGTSAYMTIVEFKR